MLCKPGKIHQIAFLSEARHLVADGFFSGRCCFSYGESYLFQKLSDLVRKAGNIFINTLRGRSLGFHYLTPQHAAAASWCIGREWTQSAPRVALRYAVDPPRQHTQDTSPGRLP